MTEEENIQAELTGKFAFLTNKVRVQRRRRVWAEVEYQNFRKVFDHAVKDMNFSVLCAITGLDEGGRFAFFYHIARENGIMLSLKTYAPKDNPVIKTITDCFPPADIYEREIKDLLGVRVEGLPAGKRYPLADDWPKDEYPLRKDWKPKDKKETTSKSTEDNSNA